MSLFTDGNKKQYQPTDGVTTNFPFPYLVYADTDMLVIRTDLTTGLDTTCILNADYTIDPADLGQPDGITIVFLSAPVANQRITLVRQVDLTDPISLIVGASLPSPVVEKQLDRLTMMSQQLNETLSRIPQIPISSPSGSSLVFRAGDYLAYDVSSGVTPQISVTPGNHKDSTGGVTWIPTIGNVTIDTVPAPVLVVGSGDTKVWFKGTINTLTGAMTALEIDSGTSLPADDSTHFYQLLTNISVDISTGTAKVTVLGGGVSGSQNYFYCGLLPTADGSGHLLNG